jgi:hypothetical protein
MGAGIICRRTVSALTLIAGAHVLYEVVAHVVDVPIDTSDNTITSPSIWSAVLLSASSLTSLLLFYAGGRGMLNAADPRRWLLTQRATLLGCAMGILLLVATGTALRQDWEVIFDGVYRSLPLHVAFYAALSVIAVAVGLPALRRRPPND